MAYGSYLGYLVKCFTCFGGYFSFLCVIYACCGLVAKFWQFVCAVYRTCFRLLTRGLIILVVVYCGFVVILAYVWFNMEWFVGGFICGCSFAISV